MADLGVLSLLKGEQLARVLESLVVTQVVEGQKHADGKDLIADSERLSDQDEDEVKALICATCQLVHEDSDGSGGSSSTKELQRDHFKTKWHQ